MAVCLSILKWKHYLMGRHFTVRSDQQSLTQREIAADYQKWISKLMAYDFEVQYKPGTSNRVDDVWSLISGGEVELGLMLSSREVDWEELHKEIESDKVLAKINKDQADLLAGDESAFTLEEGKLMYKGRLVIPKGLSMILTLLLFLGDFNPLELNWYYF